MKHYMKLLLSGLVAVILISGCKKDENRIFYEGGTPPVLTASRTGNIPLAFLNESNEAVRLTWTNPEYRFTTGVSSQNVNYRVEIDTVGANFNNPNKKVITISSDLHLSMTQGELNDYLLNQLNLNAGTTYNIQMRVVSTLGSNAARLVSNSLTFSATPFAIPPKVTPPASGTLFIVGSATPGGWNNPVPVPSQQFTQVSPTLYEINIDIVAGGSYLFLPVNGDWGAKYGALGANNTNNVNGDDFKPGGGDMLAPSVGGMYKVSVDFQRGKFTLTKL